ncbi:MAG TPA: hypothetical protein VF230_01910 [Acidimicrobiales bacterium]
MASDEEGVPPELEAAWAQRERERAERVAHPADPPAEDPIGPLAADPPADDPVDVARTGSGRDPGDTPPESRPKTGAGRLVARTVLLLVLDVAIVGLVSWLGVAGWRGGPLVVAAVLQGLLLPLTLLLTRGVPMRAAYVVGSGLFGLAGIAVAVDAAPWSHGRIQDRLEEVPFPFATARVTDRSGHGWCVPTCPTVVREIRVDGRPSSALYETAVVALDTAGFVPRDPAQTFLTRTLSYDGLDRPVVIDHQAFTTIVRLRDDGSTGVVEIEVRSRRRFKAQPDAPRLSTAGNA